MISIQSNTRYNEDFSISEELLMLELEQARQDQRSSLDHICQIILAAIAAVAIIITLSSVMVNSLPNTLSIYALDNTNVQKIDTESDELPQFVINLTEESAGKELSWGARLREGLTNTPFSLILSLCVVFAAFFYASSVGMERAFRYHYMCDLEDKLRERLADADGNRHIGWNKISSPLITLNPEHLYSKSARAHFTQMTMGIVLALSVCFLLVACFWLAYDLPVKVVTLAIALPLFLYLVIKYLRETKGSKKIYEETKRQVVAESYQKPRAQKRLGLFLSYLYPRPRDFLKVGFIVLGVLLGTSLASGIENVSDIFLRGFAAFLVIDFLAYQARYQINDIRGATEDKGNPRSRKRLLNIGSLEHTMERSVLISYNIALIKIVLAFVASVGFAIYLNDPLFGFLLAGGIIMVFGLAFVYEQARNVGALKWRTLISNFPKVTTLDFVDRNVIKSLKKASRPILAFVCFGYPLRIVSGLLAAWPGVVFHLDEVVGNTPLPIGVILGAVIIASVFFGESFVTLTWALEAADLKQKIDKDEKERFYKPHIALLGYRLGGAIREAFPLKSGVPLLRVWNVSMIASVVLMSAACITTSSSLAICLVCGFIALSVVCSLMSPQKECWRNAIRHMSALTFALAVSLEAIAILCVYGSTVPTQIEITLSVGLIVYVAIYLWFRNTNYKAMNIPVSEIIEGILSKLISVYVAFFRRIIGPATDESILQELVTEKRGLVSDHPGDAPKEERIFAKAYFEAVKEQRKYTAHHDPSH